MEPRCEDRVSHMRLKHEGHGDCGGLFLKAADVKASLVIASRGPGYRFASDNKEKATVRSC